jgi:trimeric autotransporter adhesin
MNPQTLISLIGSLALACTFATAAPQGTAFTYQGRLNDGLNPANGGYDLRFTLYGSVANGSPVGGPLTNAVAVSNGLFVVGLDFGQGVFTGEARWLEISVRTNGAEGDFTALVPRQPVMPVPYALYAASAAGLLSLDNAPLDFTVNGQRALRLEPAITGPNVIGGWSNNFVAVGASGATVGGGGGLWNDGAAIHLYTNQVNADFGTVSGGTDNTSGWYATVGGGRGNTSSGAGATVGGGQANTGSGIGATVGGGWQNASSGKGTTVGGGRDNISNGGYSTVSGGDFNFASGDSSVVGGGKFNSATSDCATVDGGRWNVSSGSGATVGGGTTNLSSGDGATVAGGQQNSASGYASTVGGGYSNASSNHNATVSGGFANTSSGFSAAVGGGEFNTSSNWNATVPGGSYNTAGGQYSFAAGRHAKALHDGSFVWADSQDTDFASTAGNQFSVRAAGGVRFETAGAGLRVDGQTILLGANGSQPLEFKVDGQRALRLEPATNGGPNVIGGWSNNFVAPGVSGATIGGGGGSFVFDDMGDIWYYYCTNRVEAGLGTVAGGGKNTSAGWAATVGGGEGNTSSGSHATVAGGVANSGSGYYATVGGGTANTCSGGWGATVGGGGYNTTSGSYATVPGGFENTAGGRFGFAAGNRAQALHDGSFVWGDGTAADVASTNANSWTVRAGGGIRFFSDTNLTVGAYLPPGGNGFSPMSDRHVKQNFKAVDPRLVLAKVSQLAVTEWNLISQPASIRHIGPMAQDFQAAFGVGEDDKHISTTDADGVALAAIQGLNQIVEEKEARIEKLEKDLADLKERVNSLLNKPGSRGQ